MALANSIGSGSIQCLNSYLASHATEIESPRVRMQNEVMDFTIQLLVYRYLSLMGFLLGTRKMFHPFSGKLAN